MALLSDNFPNSKEDDYSREILGDEILLSEIKMLLNSRARIPYIDKIPMIDSSIINYGISEDFSHEDDLQKRIDKIVIRIKEALERFEPRLQDVTISCERKTYGVITIELKAMCFGKIEVLKFSWNDSMRNFSFDE